MTTQQSDQFIATFTTKDAILYALSIGFGSSEATYEQDLPYVYEKHPDFSVVPLFCMVLFFAARKHNETHSVLPTFPPPIMKHMGIIPVSHLREKVLGFETLPVLHINQRITLKGQDLDLPRDNHTPASVMLRSSFRSIIPKAIGTYVTLTTQLFQEDRTVCEVGSTFLVLGLDPEVVVPMNQSGSRDELSLCDGVSGAPSVEETVHIGWSTSLLYRMASGDTNDLHVNGSSSRRDKPILHGLCTLGHVTRILLQNNRYAKLQSLEAKFVEPIRLGDVIVVKVWNRDLEQTRVFIVCAIRAKRNIEVVRGFAVLSPLSNPPANSRL